MTAAAESRFRKQLGRLANEELMSCGIVAFIRQLLTFIPECNFGGKQFLLVEDLVRLEIPRDAVKSAISDAKVIRALNDLDLEPDDYDKLPEILDPDHTGTLTILDIVLGLIKLRGQPRRSDSVTLYLMVRNLQEQVEQVLARLEIAS